MFCYKKSIFMIVFRAKSWYNIFENPFCTKRFPVGSNIIDTISPIKSIFIFLILSLWHVHGSSQVFLFSSAKRTDTTLWKIKNKSRNIILGNSTYTAIALNISKTKEFEFGLGRANAIVTDYGRGISYLSTTSWGFSYAYLINKKTDNHIGKFFIEYSRFPTLILGNFVLRADYSFNFSNKQQYIRPSIGLTIVYLDLLYNYSFKLTDDNIDNTYRHGITIRPKFIFNKSKWERNYFIKNRQI